MYKVLKMEAKLAHIMSVQGMKYEKKTKDWTLILNDKTIVQNISSRWIMQHYPSDVWHSVISMTKNFVVVPQGEAVVYAASNNDHVLKIRFNKDRKKGKTVLEPYWDGLLLSKNTGVRYITLLDFEWIKKHSLKILLVVSLIALEKKDLSLFHLERREMCAKRLTLISLPLLTPKTMLQKEDVFFCH